MRGKKIKMREMRSRLIFGACTIISGAAAMFGVNVLPVMAEENVGEEMVVGNDAPDTGEGELSENALNTGGDENLGVYDFKDNKTTGTVTVTKVWDDDKTNDERAIPDIKISTEKPSKSTLGYTVTFHSNGAYFADNTVENQVLYNSSGKIISGNYKTGIGIKSWYYDKECTQQFNVNEDGTLPSDVILNNDIDVYAKLPTFNIVAHDDRGNESGSTFHNLIPEDTTKIIFCNELMPKNAEVIDGVDEDGDGGVVSWMEGTIMKISTQIENQKVKVCGEAKYLFEYKKKLEAIDFTNFDTSELTSMYYWFANDFVLNDVDISNLDLKNVKDMSYMFMYGGGPELDFKLNDLYLPNLKRIDYMFSRTNARSVDLSGLNCPNVTEMYSMFYYAEAGLTSVKMDNFKAPNAKTAFYLAANCEGLESFSMQNSDLSGVLQMYNGFSYSKKLKNIHLDGLDLSSIENAHDMFGNCESITSIDFFKNIKFGINSANGVIMESFFCSCKSLKNTKLSSTIDFSHVIKINSLFSSCDNLETVDITNMNMRNVQIASNLFYQCTSLKKADMSNINASSLTDAGFMFSGCTSLETVNLYKANLNNAKNLYGMFYDCKKLITVNMDGVIAGNIQNTGSMFYGCLVLESINLSSISTETITYMYQTFYNCESLKNIDISGLSTNNVTNFSNMFAGCNNLKTLNAHIDTSSAKTLSNMFDSCYLLDKLDTSGFNTSNVTDMFALFADCKSLTEIDLSTFSTDKVTDMGYMFYGCETLSSLDVSLFNTANVTSMESMFINCNILASLKTGKDFKFIGTDYSLSGTWQNTAGETFTSGSFPSNVTDTYTKISD